MAPLNQKSSIKRGTRGEGATICEGGKLPYPMSFEVEVEVPKSFYNEVGHIRGCVCPKCPTYDKRKNDLIEKWNDELP